jgi:hypothetical protein
VEKQWTGEFLEEALLRLAVDKQVAWKECESPRGDGDADGKWRYQEDVLLLDNTDMDW